jgi:hypothetical protein
MPEPYPLKWMKSLMSFLVQDGEVTLVRKKVRHVDFHKMCRCLKWWTSWSTCGKPKDWTCNTTIYTYLVLLEEAREQRTRMLCSAARVYCPFQSSSPMSKSRILPFWQNLIIHLVCGFFELYFLRLVETLEEHNNTFDRWWWLVAILHFLVHVLCICASVRSFVRSFVLPHAAQKPFESRRVRYLSNPRNMRSFFVRRAWNDAQPLLRTAKLVSISRR